MKGTCLSLNVRLRRNPNTVLALAATHEMAVVAIVETSNGSKEDTARLTTRILSANISLVTGVPKTLVTVFVVLYFISNTNAWRLTPNISFKPELTVDFASITGVLVFIDLLNLTATVSVTADD